MSKARPFIIRGEDVAGEQLRPLPSHHKKFQEVWLQELLYQHPSILPVSCVDQAFAPPIPIGMEIAAIDNLFISPQGLLTVVETKLWRNPEAHRTVVAQILEYAHTLATWDYQKLDKAICAFMQRRHGKPKSIYMSVKSKVRSLDLSEMEFEERVQDCLENGKFALLIVGDRIYPGATQLTETIQSAPHLQYSMGLVELQCYRLDKNADWPLVVFPNFIAKTKEITRAVVKVIYEESKPTIEVTAPADDTIPARYLTFPEFIASLPSTVTDMFKSYLENWIKAEYIIFWGRVGLSVRLNWRGKVRTIFEAYPSEASILQRKWVKEFDLPEEPYEEYKKALMASSALSTAFANKKRYIKYGDMSADEVVLLLSSTDKLLQAIQDASESES